MCKYLEKEGNFYDIGETPSTEATEIVKYSAAKVQTDFIKAA